MTGDKNVLFYEENGSFDDIYSFIHGEIESEKEKEIVRMRKD